MKIAMEVQALSCCPDCDGCAECETHWSDMARPEGVILEPIRTDIRVCRCGTFWTSRLCPECRRKEQRCQRRERGPDAHRERMKERRLELLYPEHHDVYENTRRN